jgi:tetratricopeptide (TPR) repeat protein
MINLLLSLAAGIAVALAIHLATGLGWALTVVPAAIAVAGLYLALARRSWKQLEAIFEEAQKELQAQRFERALQAMERGFPLARWQFLVASQLHSQIGVLLYVRKEFDKALPHLEQSFSRHGVARAMLGVQRWRRKDLEGMKKALDGAVKTSKKEGIVWCVYAWVLDKEGRHDEAVKLLSRGSAANPSDEKLKAALQALQNDKKPKLGKLYGEQWYQFHLEPVPPQVFSGGLPRGSRRAIYGRR